MVAFLRWAAAQPWGAAWRATLPVGGVDGTLASRFAGHGARGAAVRQDRARSTRPTRLSGYMIARSGRTLIFSFYANDVPGRRQRDRR